MSNETPIDLSSFPETPEAGPYILLERENARLREELAEAKREIDRLNQWADSFTDAHLKERQTGDALVKETMQRAEQAEARALAAEKDKKQLLTRLVDALESAVDWAGYASEYFREKHQHQLDIDKLDAARDELAAIDAAIGAKHEPL